MYAFNTKITVTSLQSFHLHCKWTSIQPPPSSCSPPFSQMAAANVHPIQRPLKGSRISSFYPVKEIPPLSSLDSAFQLQEYISLLIRKDVHDVDAIVTIPGKGKQREGSDGEGKGDDVESAESKEVTVDEACWIYEQLRYASSSSYIRLPTHVELPGDSHRTSRTL